MQARNDIVNTDITRKGTKQGYATSECVVIFCKTMSNKTVRERKRDKPRDEKETNAMI